LGGSPHPALLAFRWWSACCLIVYGVSANRRSWWRRDGWGTIGYAPVDDAEAFASRISERLPYRFQGGEMAEP
jgi:hypothetical protein